MIKNCLYCGIEFYDNTKNKIKKCCNVKHTKLLWKEENKERVKIKNKEYYNNIKDTDIYKEKSKLWSKSFREKNRDKVLLYKRNEYRRNKNKYIQYRLNNKSKINKWKRDNYIKNKEIILSQNFVSRLRMKENGYKQKCVHTKEYYKQYYNKNIKYKQIQSKIKWKYGVYIPLEIIKNDKDKMQSL